MAERAASVIDHLLPYGPPRQWGAHAAVSPALPLGLRSRPASRGARYVHDVSGILCANGSRCRTGQVWSAPPCVSADGRSPERTEIGSPVLRQNSVRRQVVDLSALIRRQSQLDDHPPSPPAPPPPLPRRRPSPTRPREPSPAPAARRLQANGAPAEAAHDRPPVVGRAGQSLDRLAACSGHRVARHRPAMAAPTLPRVLDSAVRSVHGRPPCRQCRDHSPRQENDRGESLVGAHRLPPYTEAPPPALSDLADVPRQPSATWSRSTFSPFPPLASASSSSSSCSLTTAGGSSCPGQELQLLVLPELPSSPPSPIR
jgi:hypothetical protein